MIQRLINMGKTEPLHLVLLPVYFIFHAWVRYAGLLDTTDCLFSLLKTIAGILLFFFICRLVLKDSSKAAVFTTIAGVFFLFFGDIKYGFSQVPLLRYIAHYKIFIPFVLIVLVINFIGIKRTKNIMRATFFLNLLLLIYIILDLFNWISPRSNSTGIVKTELQPVPKKTDPSPSIYYLLLDCYPSPGYQQEMLNMEDNHYLDSVLASKGFYTIKGSTSNYSNTAFSMAASFGLNYLTNTDTVYRMAAHHYNRAMSIVKYSPFFKILQEQGYQLHNYSIFDIGRHKALKKDVFISATTNQMLFYNTIWSSLTRDMIWQLMGSKKQFKAERIKELKKAFEPQKTYNLRLLDSLTQFQPSSSVNTPLFLYAHLEMPHFPYFFDEAGKPYTDEELYTDSLISDRKKFARYIRYTNNRITSILDHIMTVSGGQSVIIIQSDHAIADMDWSRKQDAFRNYSAFYFPDKDYSALYPGMSNVNTFRVILNKYFGQRLPLLTDKSFYTR